MKKVGCSGFAYVVNYAEEAHSDDVVFEDRGVRIFVDRESLALIDGTTVVYRAGRARASVVPILSPRTLGLGASISW